MLVGAGCGDDDTNAPPAETFEYDYIIVGSGAGGGPLASRLACSGQRVLLLEAGEDSGEKPTYQIPLFFTAAAEDPDISWDYWAEDYKDPAKQALGRNRKEKGVLYNRGATLGGSSSHHALINMRPSTNDWDQIASITGDTSWSAANMDRYYGKVREWLTLEIPDPAPALADDGVLAMVGATVMKTVQMGYPGPTIDPANVKASLPDIRTLLMGDVNDKLKTPNASIGTHSFPLSTKNGVRVGARDRIVAAQAEGCKLTVKTSALVSKVIFDEGASSPRAVGVEYLEGKNIYRADKAVDPAAVAPAPKTVKAQHEVVLSAGVFGTPQILKLSGIGPRAELDALKIPVRVDSPGVGENMQDRYEIPVIFDQPFSLFSKCTFAQTPDDACLAEWIATKTGPYTNNGVPTAALIKSTPEQPVPDLQILGFPFSFTGYFPGYSGAANLQQWTWLILKSHTANRGGTVKLKSTDPRDYPLINFNYFEDGSTSNGEDKADMDALVKGVEIVRGMAETARTIPLTKDGLVESLPGGTVTSRADLEAYIRKIAWGHHASCSAPMGADNDPKAVLDSHFRVRGVSGLRVVDASAFPRIPGSFVVVPIYMMSEKAADVILEDQKK